MKARKTRWVGMIAVGLLLAGCGVDWFPEDSGTFNNNSSASNPPSSSGLPTFSWPAQTVASINANGDFNVEPQVTVDGTSTTGWPLSVRSIPAGTTTGVFVNSTLFLTPADNTTITTVKPGDTLKFTMQPSLTLNTSVFTKVILGTYSTTIKLTTIP